MENIHWRLAMEQRRDPRRGFPSSDELKKTTEPLAKKRKVKQAERDALKQAVEDLDSGNPQEPKTNE
jgi:hypothetical protein